MQEVEVVKTPPFAVLQKVAVFNHVMFSTDQDASQVACIFSTLDLETFGSRSSAYDLQVLVCPEDHL